MTTELQEIPTKGVAENSHSGDRDGYIHFSQTDESSESGKLRFNHCFYGKWWARFLGLMIIINLVMAIACIAVIAQLRSEVMLLKQEKTSPTRPNAEALSDNQHHPTVAAKPISVTSHAPIKCEKGDRGLKGETGNDGMPGPIGPKGQKGDDGVQGLNGTKGDTGSPGLPGTPGNRGPIGIGLPGEQGAPGIPGEEGPEGDRGEPGYNGTKGLKGDVGAIGPRGPKGSKGERGDMGLKGERGFLGVPGVDGTKGNKGDTGSSGQDGRKGTNGQRGEKGEPGQKGNTGLSGRDGINGVRGAPGMKGIKGEPGETPNITALVDAAVQRLQRTSVNANIRLINSGSYHDRGRVEVLHNGVWGTVCDDGWDLSDGAVVCRMLGFAGVTSVSGNAAYGQGTGQIWLDNVNCNGRENDISNCPKNPWGNHNCGHNEDASVVCHY